MFLGETPVCDSDLVESAYQAKTGSKKEVVVVVCGLFETIPGNNLRSLCDLFDPLQIIV